MSDLVVHRPLAEGIVEIRLNRPESRNAISPALIDALERSSAAGGADAAALLGAGDADKPIGRAIAALETRRELHSVACTPAHAGLDAGLGVDRAAGRPPAGDLWSRFYTIFAGGRALCLVHEVFSPRLQTLGLGPQRRSPADAGAGGAGEEEEEGLG